MGYELNDVVKNLTLKSQIKYAGTKTSRLVSNLFAKMKSGIKKRREEFKQDVEQAKEEAIQYRNEYNVAKAAPIQAKIEQKQLDIQATQANATISKEDKAYIVHLLEDEVNKLISKKKRVSQAPRRLLISAVFIKKLLANRAKRLVLLKQQKAAKKASVAEQSPKVASTSVEKYREKYSAYQKAYKECMDLTADLQELIKDPEVQAAIAASKGESVRSR